MTIIKVSKGTKPKTKNHRKKIMNKINKALKTATNRPMMSNGFRARRIDRLTRRFAEVTTDFGHAVIVPMSEIRAWVIA